MDDIYCSFGKARIKENNTMKDTLDTWINLPRKNRNAIANYFDIVGTKLLTDVLIGNLSHKKATEIALMLRRLKLDDDLDADTINIWFKRQGL